MLLSSISWCDCCSVWRVWSVYRVWDVHTCSIIYSAHLRTLIERTHRSSCVCHLKPYMLDRRKLVNVQNNDINTRKVKSYTARNLIYAAFEQWFHSKKQTLAVNAFGASSSLLNKVICDNCKLECECEFAVIENDCYSPVICLWCKKRIANVLEWWMMMIMMMMLLTTTSRFLYCSMGFLVFYSNHRHKTHSFCCGTEWQTDGRTDRRTDGSQRWLMPHTPRPCHRGDKRFNRPTTA